MILVVIAFIATRFFGASATPENAMTALKVVLLLTVLFFTLQVTHLVMSFYAQVSVVGSSLGALAVGMYASSFYYLLAIFVMMIGLDYYTGFIRDVAGKSARRLATVASRGRLA